MVFDKYGKQTPQKPSIGSEPQKPSSAPASSYLSRLAGQVGTGSSSPMPTSSYGGQSQIWTGTPSDKNVRSSIERRLHWVETAFKKGEERQTGVESKATIASVRNRINAILTYDLPPKVRSELEIIDRELNRIL
ncbi:MAG: hypothetical protein V1703_04055 [Candidatus Altiarchaeota archaeon]